MNGRAVIFFLAGLLLYTAAEAQYTSRLGRFQVNEVKGCAPLMVTVEILPPYECGSGGTSSSCAAFYENSTESEPLITGPFTHTYLKAGVYTLQVLITPLDRDDIRIEVTSDTTPQLEVYTCANNGISVLLNDSNYDEYIINYQDGSPEIVVDGQATHEHVYSSSSEQTVTVRGHNLNADDNCSADTTLVTPRAALPAPSIDLLQVLDDQSTILSFNTETNVKYELYVAKNSGTTFQKVKNVYNQQVDTITNLNNSEDYYCFRLSAIDPCDNNKAIVSNIICSANLDLAVRNNAIDVSWAMATSGITSYQLRRTASDGTFLDTNPTRSPYADGGVICGTEYCYQLTATYSNGSRSVSLPKCGTGFSTDTPTAIRNVTATVNDNSAVLAWQTDPDFIPAEFSIEKSTSGKYALLAATAQPAFIDDAYDPEESSCYRISYKDVCDNQSPASMEICPIRLTGNLRKDNAVTLTWTAYNGWADGVSGYTIEKYSQDGVLLSTIDAGNTTSYVDASDDLDHQLYVYVIKANPVEAGLTQSTSNRITILKDPNIFHPTAFTPNGDNLNDNFTVFGQYVVGFEMQIFNRWGELLFSTVDIQSGWDGTFRGAEMPEGTYSFIALITDRTGRTFKRSGSVLLLRKE